jgi:hypothetical protein
MISNIAHILGDHDWSERWEERVMAVRSVLGETEPAGHVVPFSWKDYILPGACALCFPRPWREPAYLYMTLGPSQPLESGDKIYPWEFAIRTKEPAPWALDLLYQLLTQWLWKHGKDIWIGYSLPLIFFEDPAGRLWGGLTEEREDFKVVGDIRRLYLWEDAERLRFKVRSGQFGLLAVIAVTEDEDQLAEEATPAHLLLFLRQMEVSGICNPFRESSLRRLGADATWKAIKPLAHDDVLHELRKPV